MKKFKKGSSAILKLTSCVENSASFSKIGDRVRSRSDHVGMS